MIHPVQKQLAIFFLSAGVFLYNPFSLLQFWIVTSPVFENFLFRPIFWSFFGSKKFYDYTESAYAGFRLLELFQYDRIILLVLFFYTITKYRKRVDTPIVNYCFIPLIGMMLISCTFSTTPLHAFKNVFDTFVMFFLSFFMKLSSASPGSSAFLYLAGKSTLKLKKPPSPVSSSMIYTAPGMQPACWF